MILVGNSGTSVCVCGWTTTTKWYWSVIAALLCVCVCVWTTTTKWYWSVIAALLCVCVCVCLNNLSGVVTEQQLKDMSSQWYVFITADNYHSTVTWLSRQPDLNLTRPWTDFDLTWPDLDPTRLWPNPTWTWSDLELTLTWPDLDPTLTRPDLELTWITMMFFCIFLIKAFS